jgi:hypothetical protein
MMLTWCIEMYWVNFLQMTQLYKPRQLYLLWWFNFNSSDHFTWYQKNKNKNKNKRKLIWASTSGYSGDRDQEDQGLKPASENSSRDPIMKTLHKKRADSNKTRRRNTNGKEVSNYPYSQMTWSYTLKTRKTPPQNS